MSLPAKQVDTGFVVRGDAAIYFGANNLLADLFVIPIISLEVWLFAGSGGSALKPSSSTAMCTWSVLGT